MALKKQDERGASGQEADTLDVTSAITAAPSAAAAQNKAEMRRYPPADSAVDVEQADLGPPGRRIVLRTLTVQDLASLRFLNFRGGAAPPKTIPGAQWAARLPQGDPKLWGGWAIVAVESQETIGLFIYHAVDAQSSAAIISYGVELEARGAGLGGEAVACATEHLLRVVGFKTLFADVELTNFASRRLLHKVGFDPLTPGNTPGVEIAPDRPAQRWRIGLAQQSKGRSLINLASVGPF